MLREGLCRFVFLVFVLCVFCLSVSHGRQSGGTLHGKVVLSGGAGAVGANVLIRELARGTSVSATGSFAVYNVPPGTYTIVVSSVGFLSVIDTIRISDGETVSRTFTLVENPIEFSEIVVTGTRSEKILADVPIPTTVISERQIKMQSALRLDDLLAEEQGMFVNFNQWGVGIQVDGLDPAYTLILVDGEPVVGRTAGTLDLTRLSLGNIRRVEVVKGPSSSLYGSDALGAVVNLITERPAGPLKGSLRTRYASFETLDLSGDLAAGTGRFGAALFVERTGSGGYDLEPETPFRTMPRHAQYTVSPKLSYDFSEKTRGTISGRFVTLHSSNVAEVLNSTSTINVDDRSTLLDWSVASNIVHTLPSGFKLAARLYRAEYKTVSQLTHQDDGALFDRSTFKQVYNKAEAQFDGPVSESMITTAGAGYVYESVIADRISGEERRADSHFAFAQHEWLPRNGLDLIASFRYDGHRDYAARFTPKFSVRVKPWDWLAINGSVGSGFKAPTFQQLYLDFTNPQVGYSVFGSTSVKNAFQQLQQSGQIQSVSIDPATFSTIRPENSVAVNIGVEINPADALAMKISGFRNDLKDLIEAAAFATKTSGQQVFTYFNINKVFTQGLNADIAVKPFEKFTLSASYQYLEAMDANILRDVRSGKIFKIGSTGRVRPVQEPEYGGLFNRSRHSGTIKIAYEDEETGFTAGLRGMLRSRYGFADKNGNSILDDDSEYAPGTAVWNIAFSKNMFDVLTVRAGVENLLDVSDQNFTPFLPGRTMYAGIEMNF